MGTWWDNGNLLIFTEYEGFEMFVFLSHSPYKGSERVVSSCPSVRDWHFSILVSHVLLINREWQACGIMSLYLPHSPWIHPEPVDEITRITTTVLLKSTAFKFSAIVSTDAAAKAIPVTGRGGHRVVRRRGSHILSRQSAHRWRWGCQPHAPATLYPQEDTWYSFLLEAESTPGP
jgi:hypothetical protein